MHGKHRTWILDDGRSDDVRALAAELGADYVRRLRATPAPRPATSTTRCRSPRAILRHLSTPTSCRSRTSCTRRVPFFADRHVAFVQTPQAYGNLNNLISRGAGYMQSVFYRFIQPGKNRFNAAFCVGTNVIFRRAAIDDIGGMYTRVQVRGRLDLAEAARARLEVDLHPHACWRSVTPRRPSRRTPSSSCAGRPAVSRSCSSTTRSPASASSPSTSGCSTSVTATFYLTGIAPGLLLLVPPLQIYFDLAPVNSGVSCGTWLLYYPGFYVMQVVRRALHASARSAGRP